LISNLGTAKFLQEHSVLVVSVLLGITLLLIIPMLAMPAREIPSLDPPGEVIDLGDTIEQRFAFPFHANAFIAESRNGDMLTQAALWELYLNEGILRAMDREGRLNPQDLPNQPYLYQGFDTFVSRSFTGVVTIADAVEAIMAESPLFESTLENATDEEVKLAVHILLQNPTTSGLRDTFSAEAASRSMVANGIPIEAWTSPALIMNVIADNDKLGGGSSRAALNVSDAILHKEEFDRNVQSVLRGEQSSYLLWGIAIDQNLEAEEEGSTAGIYIMLTVIAVLAIVGLTLRSYWALVLTGAGLGILMIWLRGLSSLVGLKGGSLIELLVPIAMISLGVDFAVHALMRYREERGNGHAPRLAIRIGFAGVLGALLLAMMSDSIAFLSNLSAGIEAVIHFGSAAGIAVASSFLVLGIGVPLVMSWVDGSSPYPQSAPELRSSLFGLIAGATAVVFFALSIILIVAVSQGIGVLLLAITILTVVVAPALLFRRKNAEAEQESYRASKNPFIHGADRWLSSIVTALANMKYLVIFVALAATIMAGILAFRLEPRFDVKDFFDRNSDLVISLDKLDQHVGQLGGEPAALYIEGDLANPGAVSAIDRFVAGLSDNPYISRDTEGQGSVWEFNLLHILRYVMTNTYALGQVESAAGLAITDMDGDGFPDSREQVRAIYDYIEANGVPQDEDTLVYSPDLVRGILSLEPNENNIATLLTTGIPGSREQTTVAGARLSLEEDLEVLEQDSTIARAGLTGSPFVREAQLDAATRTIQRSLPIAAVGALVLLLVTMRSVRYAVITVIPIGLVIVWLYALMHLVGFSLNFVTATIGAVSLGVGIDYSIHLTQRFREELLSAHTKMEALRRSAGGTGVALLISASSSIVGFTIMGLAPFPLISTYGYLTSAMIALALMASLVVLPSLLVLVTKEKVAS